MFHVLQTSEALCLPLFALGMGETRTRTNTWAWISFDWVLECCISTFLRPSHQIFYSRFPTNQTQHNITTSSLDPPKTSSIQDLNPHPPPTVSTKRISTMHLPTLFTTTLTLLLTTVHAGPPTGSPCQTIGKMTTVQGRPWQVFCNTTVSAGTQLAAYNSVTSVKGCLKKCGKFTPRPVPINGPEVYMSFGPATERACYCYSVVNATEAFDGNSFGRIVLPE